MDVWLQKPFKSLVKRFGSQKEQLAYALQFDHENKSYMFSKTKKFPKRSLLDRRYLYRQGNTLGKSVA